MVEGREAYDSASAASVVKRQCDGLDDSKGTDSQGRWSPMFVWLMSSKKMELLVADESRM